MKFHLIIPSAGSGKRFASKTPKQYTKVDGKEILLYTIEKFSGIKDISSVTIAAGKDSMTLIKNILLKLEAKIPVFVVEGGKTRQQSVKNAFDSIDCEKNDFVIIHDAARPFITAKKIRQLMALAEKYGGALPCIKINDTIKLGKNGNVLKTIPRENLYLAQTPQIFRYSILKNSYEKISGKKNIFTDESSIAEYAGYKVRITDGEDSNIKITHKKDLKYFKI